MNESKISFVTGKLHVPNKPIIPFIEGHGIGPDIWRGTKSGIDTAVNWDYGDYRKIKRKGVYAGEKAFEKTGKWLPEDTIINIGKYLGAIKRMGFSIGQRCICHNRLPRRPLAGDQ